MTSFISTQIGDRVGYLNDNAQDKREGESAKKADIKLGNLQQSGSFVNHNQVFTPVSG